MYICKIQITSFSSTNSRIIHTRKKLLWTGTLLEIGGQYSIPVFSKFEEQLDCSIVCPHLKSLKQSMKLHNVKDKYLIEIDTILKLMDCWRITQNCQYKAHFFFLHLIFRFPDLEIVSVRNINYYSFLVLTVTIIPYFWGESN